MGNLEVTIHELLPLHRATAIASAGRFDHWPWPGRDPSFAK
jgi:hypothetical protein